MSREVIRTAGYKSWEVDPRAKYKEEMSRYPNGLTAHQERFLFGCIETGLPVNYLPTSFFMETIAPGQEARFRNVMSDSRDIRELIILCNLGLAFRTAIKYVRYTNEDAFPDLVQAGNEGLLRAVNGYDNKRADNAQFSTYATTVVKDRVLEFLSEDKTITIAENIQAVMRKAERLREKFIAEHGRIPTRDEAVVLLLSLGISRSRANAAINAFSLGFDRAPQPLTIVLHHSDEEEIEREISDPHTNAEIEALDRVYLDDIFVFAQRVLSARDFAIFQMIENDPVEIARQLEIPRSSIANALKRIRRKMGATHFTLDHAA